LTHYVGGHLIIFITFEFPFCVKCVFELFSLIHMPRVHKLGVNIAVTHPSILTVTSNFSSDVKVKSEADHIKCTTLTVKIYFKFNIQYLIIMDLSI
jgi:hypothetical protein